MTFKHLSVVELDRMLAEDPAPTILDIRDPASFQSGHIDGAVHLTNDNLTERLQALPTDQPLVVCCYHGNSSQSVAQWLSDQGYDPVYSLDGGYSGWALAHP